MEIRNNRSKEIEISIPWKTDHRTDKTIYVYVYPDGKINVGATGEVNTEGREALEDALTLARILSKYGYGFEKTNPTSQQERVT